MPLALLRAAVSAIKMAVGTPDQLYYSEAAVNRFQILEARTRAGYFNNIPFGITGSAADTFCGMPNANAVVAGPLFGAWLDRISQAIHNPQGTPEEADLEIVRRLQYMGNYAISAALASGKHVEAYVLLTHGKIMIPEFGRAALAGDHDFVRATANGGELTLSSAEETIKITPGEATTPRWEPLRSIGPPDFRVKLNDIDPSRDIFRYPVAGRLTDEQHRAWDTAFQRAWNFLQAHDPHMANIVRASLNTLVPAPAEPLTRGKSMAAGAAFGVVGINEIRDSKRFASHLVFGTRKHMALALRNERPEMYRPEDDPIATKPVYPPSREGHGIAPYLLDDSFINLGLARFFANVAATASPNIQKYADLSFARWFRESQQNIDALRVSGYIDGSNEWVAAALEQEMSTLVAHYQAAPEDAKQAIATNARDRLISWRAHNVIPDPQAVTFLRDTWQRGDACPPVSVPSRLSPSIEAYTHIGQRTRYVMKEVSVKEPALFNTVRRGTADPELFGVPTAGDIAFASGDIRAAREYFTAAVRKQPGSPEAWAGLALTFENDPSPAAQALLDSPQLVAAVYAAIGDPNQSPETVAAWLAPCQKL